LCPPHSWSRQHPWMHSERQSVPYHDPSTPTGEGSQEAELTLGGTFAGVASCPIPAGVLHRITQIRPKITAAPPTAAAGTSQPPTVPGVAWWPAASLECWASGRHPALIRRGRRGGVSESRV
jgi:hypothetical protein